MMFGALENVEPSGAFSTRSPIKDHQNRPNTNAQLKPPTDNRFKHFKKLRGFGSKSSHLANFGFFKTSS